MNNNSIKDLVDRYLERFEEEREGLRILVEQLGGSKPLVDRKNFVGHITASGIVFNKQNKVLLIYHKTLNKWLQPGGHVEVGEHPIDTAVREIWEETGIVVKTSEWHKQFPIPIYINSHPIPENKDKDELAHYHHDFRYLMEVEDDSEIKIDINEINDAGWFDIEKAKMMVPKFSFDTVMLRRDLR